MKRRAFVLAIAALVPACGFQLRGEREASSARVFISGGPDLDIVRELSHQLRADRHMKFTEDRKAADVMVEIASAQNQKVILALSGAGKVREYELQFTVSFRLRDRLGELIVANSEIRLSRDFSYDDTKVLAKEAEEALLVRDMLSDAASQILRRVAAVPVR